MRAKQPNVQVGDPFMEKLLLEACIEAMRTGAVVGIQDMGAAGLTCSTCRWAPAGMGLEVELDHVPQREQACPPTKSCSREPGANAADRRSGPRRRSHPGLRQVGLDAVIVGQVIPDPGCASCTTANWSRIFPTNPSPTTHPSITGQ